jgi:hypothetical protein
MSIASEVTTEFKLIARHFAPLSLGFPGAYELRDGAAVISPSPGFELVEWWTHPATLSPRRNKNSGTGRFENFYCRFDLQG